jgi:membrane-anchored glycerophosphoryl diester phosphodiesterase (GDPDase)
MNLFIILNIIGVARTLLIFAIIYFGIRLFTRYILPLILERKIKEMQSKMQERQKQQEYNRKREGDVTIEYEGKQNNIHKRSEGEYIDFEEVD